MAIKINQCSTTESLASNKEDASLILKEDYLHSSVFQTLSEKVKDNITKAMDCMRVIFSLDYQFMGTAFQISPEFMITPRHLMAETLGMIWLQSQNRWIQAEVLIDGDSDPHSNFVADYQILRVIDKMNDFASSSSNSWASLGQFQPNKSLLQINYRGDYNCYITPFSSYKSYKNRAQTYAKDNIFYPSGAILCSKSSGNVYGFCQGEDHFLSVSGIYTSLQNITQFSTQKEKRINALQVMLKMQSQTTDFPHSEKELSMLDKLGQKAWQKKATLISSHQQEIKEACFDTPMQHQLSIFLRGILNSFEQKKHFYEIIWQVVQIQVPSSPASSASPTEFNGVVEIKGLHFGGPLIQIRVQNEVVAAVSLQRIIDLYVRGRIHPLTGSLDVNHSLVSYDQDLHERKEKIILVIDYMIFQLKSSLSYWERSQKSLIYKMGLSYQEKFM
ncbi:MAG: hypothetical protein QRY72_03965 [Candidatus Rhabdochlamydia sp.]